MQPHNKNNTNINAYGTVITSSRQGSSDECRLSAKNKPLDISDTGLLWAGCHPVMQQEK